MTRLGVLALVLVQASCSVDDVEYEGKLCDADAPCPGSYSCTNGACCTPRFSVEGFAVDWRTPNTVRLSWTPPAVAKEDFLKYVVLVGKSDSELRVAEAKANQDDGIGGPIRTAEDNPELGQYELRQSGGFDPVTATSIDLLEPATEYRMRLLSFDSDGCAASTQTVLVRTDQDSQLGYPLFDDSGHPGGVPRPFSGGTSFADDAAMAFEGTTYVDWPGSDTEGTYELIGVAGLGANMNDHFPLLDFSTAFVEVAVAIEGNPIAVWGEARVILGPPSGGCDDNQAYGIAPYAFRSGPDYRVIQAPLSELIFDGNAMTSDDIATRQVCEVSLGQTFAAGQGVRVDEILLRW